MNDQPAVNDQSAVLRVLQSKPEVRAFYDKIARVYDFLSERSEAPIRQAALDLLAAQPGDRVLEIGPGTGHCLAAMGRAAGAGNAFGLDLSSGMLAEASRTIRENGVEAACALVAGDASSLPFGNAMFEAIFMSFTLELFDTPEIPRVLAECRRVLKSHGRIVVAGMSKEAHHNLMVGAFEWTHRHFPNLLDCRPIFVGRALEEAGFEIVEKRRMQMWVPVEVVAASNGQRDQS